MCGNATLTMVASSTTISCAVAMIKRARPSRGLAAAAAAAPGAAVRLVIGRAWDMGVLLVGLATVVCMPHGVSSLLARRCGGPRDPPRVVVCEQRRKAVPVAHHRRIGELAAQRLDLEAISDGLKVAHRCPPLSVLLSGPGQVREAGITPSCFICEKMSTTPHISA